MDIVKLRYPSLYRTVNMGTATLDEALLFHSLLLSLGHVSEKHEFRCGDKRKFIKL